MAFHRLRQGGGDLSLPLSTQIIAYGKAQLVNRMYIW